MAKFRIKDGVAYSDLPLMHKNIFVIFYELLDFCEDHGIVEVVITSLMENVEGRVSKSHAEGRAFDFSIKGWSEDTITACKAHLELRCGHLGAVSQSDLKRRLVVDHAIDGGARHIHIQVAR